MKISSGMVHLEREQEEEEGDEGEGPEGGWAPRPPPTRSRFSAA